MRWSLAGVAGALAIGINGAPAVFAAEPLNVGMANTPNRLPAFLVPGYESTKCYRDAGNDLLTAGLGKTGLGSGTPPPVTDPTDPAQLRRLAVWTNYRALVSMNPAGGYGVLYGPNVTNDGVVTAGEGKIYGCEYVRVVDPGDGRTNVTLMVQVPDSFDPQKACIVTATSSGSRGVYGAISAVGEWGLKQGCAVAYTDKGTGNGLHDLIANKVNRIDGVFVPATTAGKDSIFTANLSDAERTAFNTATPNRVAFKHAHSQQNPEQDWGTNTLQAIVFAFYQLNELYGPPGPRGEKRVVLDRRNTIVIASGASNGGGAALAAAEQDRHGLIDGVAVSEPNVNTPPDPRLTIRQGDRVVPVFGRTLFDYFSFANLYQPCARMDPRAAIGPAAAFLSATTATNRCTALRKAGLLASDDLAGQAAESLQKLRDYGYLAESDLLQASMYRFATNAITVTYASAYGRFGVADNLCGYSFANTNGAGAVVPQVPALGERIFGTGNGIPPTTGVNVVYNLAVGAATQDLLAVSPSSGLQDLALDGALCHRNLFAARDVATGQPLDGAQAEQSLRLLRGIDQVQLTARLKNTPAIIVHGRADTLVPVNHASRAYFGKNQLTARGATELRYIEVTNAQHFDAFIDLLPGYSQLYVPLHVYLLQALNVMYAHLTQGAPLPASQVVRTTPRGPTQPPFTAVVATPITPANVPPFVTDPAPGNQIFVNGTVLQIPD